MSNDYNVGYGKPPLNTRFKEGQSGNRKGRPKGQKKEEGIIDLLGKELKTKLILKDGTKITKEEALVRQLCNKASSGDFKSGKLILDITTRQEIDRLGIDFLKKLIEDRILTKKSVEEYIKYGKLLSVEKMPEALQGLYVDCGRDVFEASLALAETLRLMYIWSYLTTIINIKNIREALCAEQAFWEGFETVLDSMGVSERKRRKLISQAEKGREYKRPDQRLFKIAADMEVRITAFAFVFLTDRREECVNKRGYDDIKAIFFNEANIIRRANIISLYIEDDYELKIAASDIKEMIKQQEKELEEFFEFDVGSIEEIDKKCADLKKEDVSGLYAWYRDGQWHGLEEEGCEEEEESNESEVVYPIVCAESGEKIDCA